MFIEKQYNKNYYFSLLFVAFFLLSGFEYDKTRNKINSARSLINNGNYSEAEVKLNIILNDLKNAGEEYTEEKDKMQIEIFISKVNFILGEIQYKQEKYEHRA